MRDADAITRINTCLQRYSLFQRLRQNEVQFNPGAVMSVYNHPTRGIIFLEKGNAESGFQHIIERHGKEFATIGIPSEALPDAIFSAITNNEIEGYQGKGQGRPLYRYNKTYCFALTIGSNGYIVSANPVYLPAASLAYTRNDIHLLY